MSTAGRITQVITVAAASVAGFAMLAPLQPAAANGTPAVLVYADGSHHVFTANLDGSGKKEILSGADQPIVSPTGSLIAYVDTPTGHLAFASIAGANRRVLTFAAQPCSWTTDDATVSVSTSRSIGMVNVAAGTLHELPRTSTLASPQISPDNQFVSNGNGSGQTVERLDGSAPVTRSSPGGVFSPNGALTVDGADLMSSANGIGPLLVTVRGGLTGNIHWRGTITGPSSSPANQVAGAAFSPDSSTVYVGARFFLEAKDTFNVPAGVYTSTQANPTPTLLIPSAWYPSIGGGSRPLDQNGAPPPDGNLVATAGLNAGTLGWTSPANTIDYAGSDVRANLGLTYPATATSGLDFGRALDSKLSRNDLTAGATYSISLFSRDWFGNVGAPAHVRLVVPPQSRTTLGGRAVPFDLVYPARTTISGTLTRTVGSLPVAGATIDVSRQVLGSNAPFTHLGTATTDSSGRWSLAQIPGTSYYYRLTYAGDTSNAPTRLDIRVRIAHRIDIAVSSTRAPANGYVYVVARSYPPLVRGLTFLQGAVNSAYPGGGPFVRLGPHATDANGVVIYVVRVPGRGQTWHYRVDVPTALPYVASTSAAVPVTGV